MSGLIGRAGEAGAVHAVKQGGRRERYNNGALASPSVDLHPDVSSGRTRQGFKALAKRLLVKRLQCGRIFGGRKHAAAMA